MSGTPRKMHMDFAFTSSNKRTIYAIILIKCGKAWFQNSESVEK